MSGQCNGKPGGLYMNGMKKNNIYRYQHALCRIIAFLLCFSLILPVWDVRADTVESSCCRDCSILVETQGNHINVTVPQRPDFSYVRLGLLSGDTGITETGSMQKVVSGTVTLRTSALRDGIYYLQLWKSSDGVIPTEILTDRLGYVIRIAGGMASLQKSAAYDAYHRYYSQKDQSVEALYYYLKVSYLVQSEDSRIISRAHQITDGIDSAYGRAKAIHDWVADNIYYDVDAERSDNIMIGNNLFIDAVGTLNKQTSVCQGYADLTVALLRASGIPARTVIGYALTGVDEEWDQEKVSGSAGQNHAWVEAYLGNRWVLMDPTWDSRSIYYKGSGIKADCVDTYFDSTLDFFSYGHFQTVADDFSTEVIRLLFADIRDHWGYSSIRFAVNNEIMRGMGDAYFRPDGTTTQAMFMTMLSNCAGAGIQNAESGPWYMTYAAWAQSEGITDGMEGYDPEALITREQMAVMLCNFVVRQQASVEDHETVPFSDMGEASVWSREAIRKLASWNMILGRGDGCFDPQAYFTRAEAAAIVTRACDTLLRTYLNT